VPASAPNSSPCSTPECVDDKKIYLVREADDLVRTDDRGTRSAPRWGDRRQPLAEDARPGGTAKFLAAIKAGTSAAISDSSSYRMPSFGQPAVRALLLDVLAQEGARSLPRWPGPG